MTGHQRHPRPSAATFSSTACSASTGSSTRHRHVGGSMTNSTAATIDDVLDLVERAKPDEDDENPVDARRWGISALKRMLNEGTDDEG